MKQRPLLPTSLIALSVFISACAPMQNSANGPSFGSGSLTVKQDGQPANVISNLATVNWNAMTESILTPAAKKQGGAPVYRGAALLGMCERGYMPE